MTKPKNRPRRRSVEQEPPRDDEAPDETRLETFERGTERRHDDTLTRPDAPDSLAPANDRLDTND